MAQLLMIETDQHLRTQLSRLCTLAGHTCTIVSTFSEGRVHLQSNQPHAIILNARMPWANSFSFLQALSQRNLPVLFITTDAANTQHLRAMCHTPCEVLPLPFNGKELANAVAKLLRVDDRHLSCGCLEMDLQNRQVKKNGQELNLTAQEFALLHALMRSPNATLTREELLRTAWGYQTMGETRTVDVHIQRLRRKIGSAYIETIYKLGYRLHTQATA